MNWFAVYTNPQKEGLVAFLLGMQRFETLWLHYMYRPHRRGGALVCRSYFPRYLFVGLEDGQALGTVNDTAGVSTVIYQGDEPLEIPQPVIDELRLRADDAGLLHLTPEETNEQRRRFRRGQRVRITEGILQGMEAVVGLDTGGEIKVMIEMFRGKVPASLDPEAVAPF